MILRTVQSFLRREEYNIISTVDGKQALEQFESHNPDLVITDIMLPYLSGLEIVGKIKQTENPPPVIVSSSMAQEAVADEAKKLGADAFLTKPYNIAELLNCISTLLKKRSAA